MDGTSARSANRTLPGRLLSITLVMVLAAGLQLGGTATAQTEALPEKDAFVGHSLGRALKISAGDNDATLGFSEAQILSSPNASAEAAGQLAVEQTRSAAEAQERGAEERDPESGQNCADSLLDALESIVDVVTVGAACSNSRAAVTGSAIEAESTGSVAAIDLDASSVLSQLIEPIQGPLEDAFGALPGTLDPVTDTVSDLLTELGAAQTLKVRLGDSTSTALSDPSSVSVTATADGGQIDILPDTATFGDYYARIEVGSASASANHDRDTGSSTGDFDPALVRVLFADVLDTGPQTIEVAPGQSQPILEGTPLESEIIVANGSTDIRSDGSVFAVADGVRVELFRGIPGGPIILALAHTEAAVVGTPLLVTKAADPGQVEVGQEFTTTISITNPADCPITNVRVEDTITVEDGARFQVTGTNPQADTVPQGENLSEGVIVWENIGTIDPGETRTVDATFLAQGQRGRILDTAVASGSFGECPDTAGSGADVVAAALTDVPAVASASATVPANEALLPRTGPAVAATTIPGLVLMALSGLGYGLIRRRR